LTIACVSLALSLVLWEKLFGGCLAGGHFFAGTVLHRPGNWLICHALYSAKWYAPTHNWAGWLDSHLLSKLLALFQTN
jgi:hypothetical protein